MRPARSSGKSCTLLPLRLTAAHPDRADLRAGLSVAGIGSGASVLQASRFRGDVTVFRLMRGRRRKLAPILHFGGIRRNTCTRSRRLITRRSQVQILPPLLGRALETGPFAHLGELSGCHSWRYSVEAAPPARIATGCVPQSPLPLSRFGRLGAAGGRDGPGLSPVGSTVLRGARIACRRSGG